MKGSDEVLRAKALLARARRVLVFTGAGVSTGSGIPDFRGEKGVWKSRRPVYFQDFLASEEARVEHWDYKLEGYEAFRDAKPNAAHEALVGLERRGRLELLVTQNIDGLHHEAGHAPDKVVELHGTNRVIRCLSCGAESEPAAAFAAFRRTRACPTCPCGGFLKPATVSFGQAMPQEPLAKAMRAARNADLVLALGSTLEVQPAASVPLAAQRKGVPYVIVNLGPTAHDPLAAVKLDGDVCAVVPELLAA
jgi:NAD-dependent deacetylase